MIVVEDLVVEYVTQGGERVRAVDGVSLALRPGERVGLIGPNGCGKTTLARCLNALILPSAGRVEVDGIDTRDDSRRVELRQRVGMVFQNPDNQLVAATVEREIAFGLENLGVPWEQMQVLVEQALRQFGLEQYRKHPPHLLSGGEKQRLALAAVSAMRPRYLILDEPTSLLDPVSRDAVVESALRFGSLAGDADSDQSPAVLLITQFPEEVLALDRVLVMHRGRLIADDSPKGIFSRVDRLKEIGLEPPVEFLAEEIWKEGPSVQD